MPPEPMTPADMLELLGVDGENAGSDYNDADGVDGWFGWTVTDDVLTVAYRPCREDGRPGDKVTAAWQLVPIRLTDCGPPHTTDRRCLDCATDDEVLASLPSFPGCP